MTAKSTYATPASSSVVRFDQRLRQQVEALGGERGEQARLVAEVVRGRGVRDTGPTGEVAQAQRGGPDLLDGLQSCGEQGAAQVAVMVRTASRS